MRANGGLLVDLCKGDVAAEVHLHVVEGLPARSRLAAVDLPEREHAMAQPCHRLPGSSHKKSSDCGFCLLPCVDESGGPSTDDPNAIRSVAPGNGCTTRQIVIIPRDLLVRFPGEHPSSITEHRK